VLDEGFESKSNICKLNDEMSEFNIYDIGLKHLRKGKFTNLSKG